MNLELENKVFLVTGGSKGIGKAIVEKFLSEGARVSFCARGQRDLDSTYKELGQRYGESKLQTKCLDVGNSSKLEEWIQDSIKTFGSIDGIVANVSGQSYRWQECIDLDILATVNFVDYSLPFLKKSHSATIVGIASKAALLSVPSYKPYSAAKAAMISYFSSLSRELAKDKIRVNCVSPGEVYSNGGFWERIKREDNEFYQKTVNNLPFERMADAGEVADAVVFLSSARASYISGTNLLVDGAGRESVQF